MATATKTIQRIRNFLSGVSLGLYTFCCLITIYQLNAHKFFRIFPAKSSYSSKVCGASFAWSYGYGSKVWFFYLYFFGTKRYLQYVYMLIIWKFLWLRLSHWRNRLIDFDENGELLLLKSSCHVLCFPQLCFNWEMFEKLFVAKNRDSSWMHGQWLMLFAMTKFLFLKCTKRMNYDYFYSRLPSIPFNSTFHA